MTIAYLHWSTINILHSIIVYLVSDYESML